MTTLKRTVLYEEHLKCKGKMVEFGGWDMPIQYDTDIIDEHLFDRKHAGLFDVSHMGRFVIKGKDRLAFLQRVLTNNAAALEVGRAQYTMVPKESGGALDDAYLYRFYEDEFLLVVNASNADTDWAFFTQESKAFDVQLENRSQEMGMISLQGPESKAILDRLTGTPELTTLEKNGLNIVKIKGMEALISATGYTGDPIGFEIFLAAKDTPAVWNLILGEGAKPIGLGARDTLRLEAGLPLYGHELGTDMYGKEIPIFTVPLAKFAVSFAEEKGDFIGRAALEMQTDGRTPRVIKAIALLDRGVLRAECVVYKDGVEVGYVTSGTMAPHHLTEGQGAETVFLEGKGMRSVGLAMVDRSLQNGDEVEVDIRGRRLKAVIKANHMKGNVPPYVIIQ